MMFPYVRNYKIRFQTWLQKKSIPFKITPSTICTLLQTMAKWLVLFTCVICESIVACSWIKSYSYSVFIIIATVVVTSTLHDFYVIIHLFFPCEIFVKRRSGHDYTFNHNCSLSPNWISIVGKLIFPSSVYPCKKINVRANLNCNCVKHF